jgi:tyrosine-protein phosphatase OCA6
MHCLDGANNTGLVVMCLRRLQNWSLSYIFAEFVRFTRDAHINSSESEFVETFREEIMIPSVIPKWLWSGERINEV